MLAAFSRRNIRLKLSPEGKIQAIGDLTDGDREAIRRNRARLISELGGVESGQSEPTPEQIRLAREIELEVPQVLSGSEFLAWSIDCRKKMLQEIDFAILGVIMPNSDTLVIHGSSPKFEEYEPGKLEVPNDGIPEYCLTRNKTGKVMVLTEKNPRAMGAYQRLA